MCHVWLVRADLDPKSRLKSIQYNLFKRCEITIPVNGHVYNIPKFERLAKSNESQNKTNQKVIGVKNCPSEGYIAFSDPQPAGNAIATSSDRNTGRIQYSTWEASVEQVSGPSGACISPRDTACAHGVVIKFPWGNANTTWAGNLLRGGLPSIVLHLIAGSRNFATRN